MFHVYKFYEKVLNLLKKGETIETIEHAVKEASELELDAKIFIIIGKPHKTKVDIEDIVRLAKDILLHK
jgi:radical SAM superfamily enzyme YgiQ (UPF0313 family)